MNSCDASIKKVRFDTPTKSEPRLRTANAMASKGCEPQDFNRFLSEYIGDTRASSEPAQAEKPAAFGATPKPSCELELSVYDYSKDAPRRQANVKSDSVLAGAAGEGMHRGAYPPVPPRKAFKQSPEHPWDRQAQGHASRKCCGKCNFKSKSVGYSPHAHAADKHSEKEIDDRGFFLRPQLQPCDRPPPVKCHNPEFQQIMRPQFLRQSNSSETMATMATVSDPQARPEARFADKVRRAVINSGLEQSIAMGAHKPIAGGFFPAGTVPTMVPVYPESMNMWPEVPPQYLIGYAPDGRGFVYPYQMQQQFKQSNLKEKETQSCIDDGVGAKVKAIMSRDKTPNDNSQEEVVHEPAVEETKANELTVNDLFDILKRQNDQLEKLYNKVDLLLEGGVNCSRTVCGRPPDEHAEREITAKEVEIQPPDNAAPSKAEQETQVNTIKDQLHHMSIGVMTSFEMVMTSTHHFPDPKAIYPRMNKAEVAIQSVADRDGSNSVLENLDPCKDKIVYARRSSNRHQSNIGSIIDNVSALTKSFESGRDKSYGNVTMNFDINPSRPISPQPSMHLEMKDYSGVGSADISHSERGWTYFNKVVNNVDEILGHHPLGVYAETQTDRVDKDTARRNAATATQQDACLSISDISFCSARRVKFGTTGAGTDSLGTYSHTHNRPITDTSMRINQLAKKYLKDQPNYHRHNEHRSAPNGREAAKRRPDREGDYAFGTIHGKTHYFEKHKFMMANDSSCERSRLRLCKNHEREMHCSPSNILDIQALKRQPKFL